MSGGVSASDGFRNDGTATREPLPPQFDDLGENNAESDTDVDTSDSETRDIKLMGGSNRGASGLNVPLPETNHHEVVPGYVLQGNCLSPRSAAPGDRSASFLPSPFEQTGPSVGDAAVKVLCDPYHSPLTLGADHNNRFITVPTSTICPSCKESREQTSIKGST